MKRKTAKEILAESFRELAGSKPVDKITVPSIIHLCLIEQIGMENYLIEMLG